MWKTILPALLVLGTMLAIRPTVALTVGSAAAVLAEARAALDGGDAAQARRLAEDGLKEPGLEPLARARLLLDRGLASELLGVHDQALVDFTAAINAHMLPAAEQAQALLQRGFLLDSLGRLGPALGDYTAAIHLLPDSAKAALNNRANIYRRQNRLKEAKRDYLAALQGDNPHPEYPYTGLGQIAEAEGDAQTARRYYAQATAANAHYALAVERLAALGGPPPDMAAAQEPVKAPVKTPVAAAATLGGQSAPIRLHMPRKVPPAPARTAPRLRPAIDGGVGSGQPQVQLGAWRSQAEAQAGWERARRRAGSALDGLSRIIVAADLPGKGRYYRLRVAPGRTGARALCDTLGARGQDCLVIRN